MSKEDLFTIKEIAVLDETKTRAVFKARFRKVLKEQKLSYRDVEKATGISHITIAQYAAGSVIPRLTSLVNLAVNFDVSIDYLCGLDD